MNEIIDDKLSIDDNKLHNIASSNIDITEIIQGEEIALSYRDFKDEDIQTIGNQIKNPERIKKIIFECNEIKIFPERILNLPNLEHLNLENNNIEFIPKEISKLINLKKLLLANNSKIKKLPKEIGELKLDKLSINLLHKDDYYLKDIIPEIQEIEVSTNFDFNDNNRG